MSTITPIDFFKLWTIGDDPENERLVKKFLRTGLDMQVQAQPDVLGRIKMGPETSNPVVRWGEAKGYPTSVSLSLDASGGEVTFYGPIMGKTITADLIKQCVREGTILQDELNKGVIRIDDVSGLAGSAPFTATYTAHGGTDASIATHATGREYRIIAEGWTDLRDMDDARGLGRDTRKVGCQIFAEQFLMPKTRKNTAYEFVANEFSYQVDELINKMRRQLGYAIIRGVPAVNVSGSPIYGDEAEETFMCGLSSWPRFLQAEESNTDVYVDAGSQEIDKFMLSNLMRAMQLTEFANFDRGNWGLMVHPVQKAYIDLFDEGMRRSTPDAKFAGYEVTKILVNGKWIPVIEDQYMLPDEAIPVDFSQCEYGYYANDQMNRDLMGKKGRYEEWLISFQAYGVVLRNARKSIGKIYGLKSTAPGE